MNAPKFPWLLAMLSLMVILLGAWLFMPVYSGGGEPPAIATCLSNVKQTGLGLVMYSTDYDDRFPNRDEWMDVIKPYTKNEDILHCPALGKKQKTLYGYCFNRDLSGQKAKGTEPLVFESVNMARNASGALDSLPDPARHKGVNYVFHADGSSKGIPVASKKPQSSQKVAWAGK